jgi:hypothetical protein
MNKKIVVCSSILFFAIAFFACNEDKVQKISKDGSVETTIKIDHLTDSADVVITTHKVWVKNTLVKTSVHKDTVPMLGFSSQQAENNEGETNTVVLKKEYELYITVE